jgi:hypothetical protein
MNNLQNNQKSDATPMGYDALLGAVNSLREKLYKAIELDKEVKHSLQYRDYPEGAWTLPCQLLDYRIENFYRDLSLRKVKLEFSNKTIVILDA